MFFCAILISLSAVNAETQDLPNTMNSSEVVPDNSNFIQNKSDVQNNSEIQKPTESVNDDLNTLISQDSSENPYVMAAGSDATESFTINQIKDAASRVRNHVETYRTLPGNVTIGTTQLTMPQFLELLTSALLQITGGNNSTLSVGTFNNPVSPKENIHAGNIYKSEYLKIASDIKNYMDSTGKSPDYAYGTSIGTYLRFENLVYMYSMILNYHNTSGKMADWAAMEPWSVIISKPVIDPNASRFTVDQIKTAAVTVRNYVETYHKLPSSVQIGSSQITMPQFLELLTTALLQITSGNNSTILLRNFSNPVNPVDDMHEGNIPRVEFLKIAGDIKNYMDNSGKSPDYAYGTSIGPKLRFENLVYMYSMILDYYNSSGKIADWATMEPWSLITSRPVLDPNAPKFTVDQIKNAASLVRANIENNHNLPDKVTINGTDVTIAQFLELLTTALLQINDENSNSIPLRNFSDPVSPKENIQAGYMYKAEYLKIAGDVKKYMDSTGKSPDYAYGTSLGTYLRFESLVYMYAMILDYYTATGKTADFAIMKPWNAVLHPPKIEIIITGTGGTIANNYLIMQNIPHNQFIDEILSVARNGTPMITFGDGNGPKVMITAGVHGNELPSQIAVMKLINYLYGTPIKGTVYVMPFVAPSSTAQNTRLWNGQNLNSIANVAGTPTNQIMNLARGLQVNALGDFHSTQPGGVPGQNSVLCSKSPTYGSFLIADYISRNTGSALVAYNQAGVDYPGALEDVTNLAGIPAVTCEVLSSHGTVAAGSVDMSFSQLLAFLRYHGML